MAKTWSGAPFGKQSARFSVSGLHPNLLINGQIPYDSSVKIKIPLFILVEAVFIFYLRTKRVRQSVQGHMIFCHTMSLARKIYANVLKDPTGAKLFILKKWLKCLICFSATHITNEKNMLLKLIFIENFLLFS